MNDWFSRQPENIRSIAESVERSEARLKELTPDSDQAKRMSERISFMKLMRDGYKTRIATTADISFSEKMTLDLGDITLKIYFMGPAHSLSDIFIFVPEEETLFTGDISFDRLQSRLSKEPRISQWISNVREILEGSSDDLRVIGGHGGVQNRDVINQHLENCLKFIRKNGERRSGAYIIQQEIESSGVDAALRKYNELKTVKHEAFYFDEWELFNLGWEYLRFGGNVEAGLALYELVITEFPDYLRSQKNWENRISRYADFLSGEAIISDEHAFQMYRLNLMAFPESANAYIAMGKAFLKKQNMQKALESLQKAHLLNPDNEEVKNLLEQLTSEK